MAQPGTELELPGTRSSTGPREKRSRPTKPLPTERMRLDIQVKVLETFARLSGSDRRWITSERVAQSVENEVSRYTVPLSNAFFVACGWLDKKGRGDYAALDPLVTYRRRSSLNPDDPSAKKALADSMQEAWFWAPIVTTLTPVGAKDTEIYDILMIEAEAGPEHRLVLKMLLEWVEWVGLIDQSDDGRFTLAAGVVPAGSGSNQGGSANGEVAKVDTPTPQVNPPAVPAPAEVVRPTNQVVQPDAIKRPPAMLSFSFQFDMTAEDMAKLKPEHIQALFSAVGNVMSIRAELGQ